MTATGDACYVFSGLFFTALLVWQFDDLKVEWALLALSGANATAMIVERLRLDRRWWRGYQFKQLLQYREIWQQSRWALVGAMTTLFLALSLIHI